MRTPMTIQALSMYLASVTTMLLRMKRICLTRSTLTLPAWTLSSLLSALVSKPAMQVWVWPRFKASPQKRKASTSSYRSPAHQTTFSIWVSRLGACLQPALDYSWFWSTPSRLIISMPRPTSTRRNSTCKLWQSKTTLSRGKYLNTYITAMLSRIKMTIAYSTSRTKSYKKLGGPLALMQTCQNL